jgi:hypothetical protein
MASDTLAKPNHENGTSRRTGVSPINTETPNVVPEGCAKPAVASELPAFPNQENPPPPSRATTLRIARRFRANCGHWPKTWRRGQ